MARQISAFVPEEFVNQIDQLVVERRKTFPMTTRADLLREFISQGLAHAKLPKDNHAKRQT